MKHERYQIFFDSPMGLIPGSLDLCQANGDVSGSIRLWNHDTSITGGSIDGNKRDFSGTIWFKQEEVPFCAKGELSSDEILDLDVTIGSKCYPLTGFPIEPI